MRLFWQYTLIGSFAILGGILTACSGIESEDSPERRDAILYLQVMTEFQGTIVPTISRADDSEKTADPSIAAGDNEKIHELRIIIVRPNLIVEHNDYITEPFLNNPDIYAGTFQYRVTSGERKFIYLIANETAARTVVHKGQGEQNDETEYIKLIDYDFSKIAPGTSIDNYNIHSLLINLGGSSETLNGILPMSECHVIDVPRIQSQSDPVAVPVLNAKLHIRRAAVKFSVNITNSSTLKDFEIESLLIDKVSRKEYFLPRGTEYNNNGEIIDYQVPNIGGNEYYTFYRDYTGIFVNKGGGAVSLPPFYLLEGRYSDPDRPEDSDQNYSMTLCMNGNRYTSRLPNLPQLPRNTHIVINADIRDNEMSLQVDLRPYSSVGLKPTFGLDYPEG